jgi:hypothetical protein
MKNGKELGRKELGRRDLFRALGAGVAVAAAEPFVETAVADESNDEKRKARYQANSPDVQDFYRVNRYPKKPN